MGAINVLIVALIVAFQDGITVTVLGVMAVKVLMAL